MLKIINIIKEFILEKDYELEHLENEIEDYNNYINELNKVIKPNISIYKLSLLTYKYKILDIKNKKLYISYINEKNKSKKNKIIIRTIKHILLLVIIISLTLLQSPISLIYLLISISIGLIYTTTTTFSIYYYFKTKNKDEIIKILNDSNTTLKKLKENLNSIIEEALINKKDFNKEDKEVNELIIYYLNNESDKEITLPEELNNYIKESLQSDLNSVEEYINVILNDIHNNYNKEKEEFIKTLKLIP